MLSMEGGPSSRVSKAQSYPQVSIYKGAGHYEGSVSI